MYHDFDDFKPHKGNKPHPCDPSETCAGYMDYNPKTHGWSKCDRFEMNTYFNSLTEKEFENCLERLPGASIMMQNKTLLLTSCKHSVFLIIFHTSDYNHR